MQIQQQYGTEAIQRFALRVLDLANVDKNADGKVDAQEWGQLVFGLVPELLNIKQLNNEVRDLTVQEVTDIVMLVGANFPDYLNLKTEVENVIRLALKFLAVTTSAGYDLLLAVKALNKTPLEVEVAAKASTEKKKAKMESGAAVKLPAKKDKPLSKEQPLSDLPEATPEEVSEPLPTE